ncbi:MAG: glycosyltransferase family 4 protein [Acidobacteria bacterium]|nr:glycosyltransferase family 4 protein [Acidobacteriota bacterium]
MTVLQLGPYPPPHGGVQTNLVAIRDHLRRHGMSAPVINLTRHRREARDEVFYPSTAREVVKLLWTIPSDIIHLHLGGELTGRLLALCFVCSLLPGRRLVLTFHSGGYPSGDGGRSVRARSLRGFILRRPDAVIAVNLEIANWFRRLGVPEERINLICPFAPVSVPDETVMPPAIRDFARAHSPLLTTVGLLEPEYDLALQIGAMSAIRQRYPGAGLVIVGSGSLDRQLRDAIAAAPAARDILLCGDVPHAATIRLLADSDVFLRTTLYDGDSVSVREALQVGVPVIASDNGMRPDGVHLIPRSDPHALVAAIDDVLRRAAGSSSAAGPTQGLQPLDDVIDLYRRLVGGQIEAVRPPMTTVS